MTSLITTEERKKQFMHRRHFNLNFCFLFIIQQNFIFINVLKFKKRKYLENF